MPRRVEDLASRVEDVEGEIEQLVDDYVDIHRRLRSVEARVGTGDDRAEDLIDIDATGNGSSGGESDEQASPDDVADAVGSVDEDPEGNDGGNDRGDDDGNDARDDGENRDQDDIIIA